MQKKSISKSMGLMSPLETASKEEQIADGLRGIQRLQKTHPSIDAFGYEDGATVYLSIDRLSEYSYNPRWVYLDEAVLEMAESIRAHGILNPIHVSPDPDREGWFMVLAGRTRIRAIRQYLSDLEEYQKVPAIIHLGKSQKELAMLAYMENDARTTQFPVDIGLYFQKLLEDGIFATQAELAGAMRITTAKVVRLLSFGRLHPTILEVIKKAPNRFSHIIAYLLLRAQTEYGHENAEILAKRYLKEEWSARRLEHEVEKMEPSMHKTRSPNVQKINLFTSPSINANVKISDTGRIHFSLGGVIDLDKRQAVIEAMRKMVDGIRAIAAGNVVDEDCGSVS